MIEHDNKIIGIEEYLNILNKKARKKKLKMLFKSLLL